jgi:hypothetical protein
MLILIIVGVFYDFFHNLSIYLPLFSIKAKGAAIYRFNHKKAVDIQAEILERNKDKLQGGRNMTSAQIREVADSDVNALEDGLIKDWWEEMAARMDANNDRGKLRDRVRGELTAAWVTKEGVESASELDDETVEGIESAATLIMRDAVRESWETGGLISESPLFSIKAKGAAVEFPALKTGTKIKTRRGIDDYNAKRAAQINDRIQTVRTKRETAHTKRQIRESDARTRAERRSGKWLFQSAMYRSPQPNLASYFKYVNDNPNPQQKSFFPTTTNGGVKIRISHDAVRHSINDHQFTAADWGEFISTLDNKIDALIGNESNSYGRVARIKIKSGGSVFGAVISENGHITTVFRDSEGKVDSWLREEKASQLPSATPARAHNLMLGQPLSDIIAQIKSEVNNQSSVDAASSNGYRAAYSPSLQKIIFKPNADVTSIVHEFSHLFMDNYFKWMRSGMASESFRRRWGAVEKWAGIRPSDIFMDVDASEKFARAYEKWVMDGGKGAPMIMPPFAFPRTPAPALFCRARHPRR